MAAAIVNKVLDFLGVETNDQEDYEEELNEYGNEEENEQVEEKGFFNSFSKRGKVVNMPQVQQVKMVIM